jgi:ribonuclease E
MANKMLIDASHPEETRVVVLRGNKVEEFDFESASRKQLRGNIYLAKVTRVEPSLQAAFIEYGGNRHGFLAFSEIHPDYYQIPVADRQALLEEDARAEREYDRQEERKRHRRDRGGPRPAAAAGASDETVSAPAEGDLEPQTEANGEEPGSAGEFDDLDSDRAAANDVAGSDDRLSGPDTGENAAPASDWSAAEAPTDDESFHRDEPNEREGGAESESSSDESGPLELASDEEPVIEQVGGTDALEEVPDRPRSQRRHYKIQEVIKRRQVILVQVVKEERGNKGAALTTYLSIAGRYSVLMPNTGRGGGISRKITSAADRKRLREVAEELEVPEGMGVILRTAGASRTKTEIKRDFEYLMRLWESVRELTLQSTAPALVYEEGSLVKRAIRDLYNKDVDEVLVSGDDAYREARDFMRMLMPSHAKIVKPYKDPQPLFARYGIEAQLDAMFSSHVSLKSGGYLVINPTEALVSIDVNSGRSTREHNIEDTALRTNLEAAEEIARQLRLRDLAGLIVIDFIDMDEKRNNRAVEKKLNECLKDDRARIQVGRISPFGLLEMSRQRIRTGVLESSSVPCPHCAGAGLIRATPSVALNILRSLEESLIRSASHNLAVRTRTEVALYVLNSKRAHLRDLEVRFGVALAVVGDDTLGGSTVFAIDRTDPAVRVEPRIVAPVARLEPPAYDEDEAADLDAADLDVTDADSEDMEDSERESSAEGSEAEGGADEQSRRRRRRRRRRGGRGSELRDGAGAEAAEASDASEDGDVEPEEPDETDRELEPAVQVAQELVGEDERQGRRRRRGRRGGRGRERDGEAFASTREEPGFEPDEASESGAPYLEAEPEPTAPDRGLDGAATADPVRNGVEVELPAPAAVAAEIASAPVAAPEPEPEPVAVVLTPPDPERPKRAGWWSKAKAAFGS